MYIVSIFWYTFSDFSTTEWSNNKNGDKSRLVNYDVIITYALGTVTSNTEEKQVCNACLTNIR